jgi:hypothetical protein
MEKPGIVYKFFSRTESWDWLNRDMIHVLDSKRPRMVTMDPWPQQIYLDADGQRTVEAYVESLRARYPRGSAPDGLADAVIDELRKLVEEEGLVVLTDEPVELPGNIRDPLTPSLPIEMSGTWEGSYEYEIPDMPTVNFIVEIDEVRGSKFSGTVKDDEAMGGTPGIGRIEGKVVGDGVIFTKQMPIYFGRDEQGTRVVDPGQKHPTLHYTGEFAPSNQRLSGTWRFKTAWLWKGWIPYRVSYISGRWYMRKVSERDASAGLVGSSRESSS